MDEPQVNAPASGSYGAKQQLQNLKDALPGKTSGQGGESAGGPLPPISEQPRPAPDQGGRPVTGAAVPPGLPSILAAPTQQPGVPVSTPLQQGPALPQTPPQERLLWLDQLANDPSVSQATREWASAFRDAILRGQPR